MPRAVTVGFTPVCNANDPPASQRTTACRRIWSLTLFPFRPLRQRRCHVSRSPLLSGSLHRMKSWRPLCHNPPGYLASLNCLDTLMKLVAPAAFEQVYQIIIAESIHRQNLTMYGLPPLPRPMQMDVTLGLVVLTMEMARTLT